MSKPEVPKVTMPDSSDVSFTFRSEPIETATPYPIIVAIDTTGSMKSWPAIFFEKLPLLYGEAQKYFPGSTISFQAVNDYFADGEDVCFQPAPFGAGPELDGFLRQLVAVGGGGAQMTESYEVAAAWNASRVQTNAALIKPLLIFLGDERPFKTVPAAVARELELESTETQDVFRRLNERMDVYLIRKPYRFFGSQPDEHITAAWREYAFLEEERILELREPERVVDVILGVLGALSGKQKEFEQELASRQSREQSRSVLKTLASKFSKAHRPPSDSALRLSVNPPLSGRPPNTEDLSQ